MSLHGLDTFSYNNGYALTPHVLTWRTDNLDDVKLDQEAHELPHLEELLSGSTALTLSLGYDLGRAYIIARRARGVYTVFFQDAGGDVVSAAPIFLAAQAGLQGVASLEVSFSALSAFLPILSALPALKQLGVYIEARAPDDDAPHALPSDALFTLPRAVKA